MSTRKRLILMLGFAAILLVAGLLASGRLPVGAQESKAQQGKAEQGKAEEKEGVAKGRRMEFIAAFDKGDAKGVAAFWTSDATYVDQGGREFKGRQAIEQMYSKSFAARKGSKLGIQVFSIKQVTPDVVLEDGITEVTPADGGPPIAARFAALLVKQDGQWYLQSVRDSAPPTSAHAEHLDDLEWLIGAWTSEAVKGDSTTATYEWTENQNFIISTFDLALNGVPVVGGTQWIGWDAVDKQVRSWTFYSRGGAGQATWTKEGNSWSLKTTARTADGQKVSATNIMRKVDDDHMTWQMTKLTVDGEQLPDRDPVKMKRIQSTQP